MPNSIHKLNYYEILGIPTTASFAEIKQAFRQLAHSYHPDRSIGQSAATRKFAEDKFKEINEAYEVLKDTQRRQDYKRELDTATIDLKKQELIPQIQELYENQNLEEAVKVAKVLYEFLPEDLDCSNIYAGLAYELAIKLGEKEQLSRSASYLQLALEISQDDEFKRKIQADISLLIAKKEQEEDRIKAANEREKFEAERRIKEKQKHREVWHYEPIGTTERNNRREVWHYEPIGIAERRFRKKESERKIYNKPKALNTRFFYSEFYHEITKLVYKDLAVIIGIFMTVIISLLGFGSLVNNLRQIVDNVPGTILAVTMLTVGGVAGSIIYLSNNIKIIKAVFVWLWRLSLIAIILLGIWVVINLMSYTIHVFLSISPLGRIGMGLSLLLSGIIVLRK